MVQDTAKITLNSVIKPYPRNPTVTLLTPIVILL